MENDLSNALTLFQSGRLEEAKKICVVVLKNDEYNSQALNLNGFISYYQKNFDEAIKHWQKAIKINPNYIEAYNGCGNAYKNLKQLEKAVECFNKAIQIEPRYLEAYINLGNVLIKLEKFEEAIINFDKVNKFKSISAEAFQGKAYSLMKLKKYDEAIFNFNQSIKMKPNDANTYYNLGATYESLEKWQDAADNFSKAMEIDSNHNKAFKALLHLLEFYNPKEESKNFVIRTNNLLKNNNINLSLKNKISDDTIINYYSKISNILDKNFDHHFINDKSQIFRDNAKDLNCERHFEVFNTYNVIPKFCFDCYKIQIDIKNVLELFKLYLVFDKIKLEKNNIRKCMIEIRDKVSGNYKGLIYCSGLSEAQRIEKYLNPIIKKTIGEDLSIFIKRGCTEFAVSYPKYKKIDQSMNYNNDWIEKEKIVDDKLQKRNKFSEKILKETLEGLSINDALIMKNWLYFAKSINDESYKKFNTNIPDSEYLYKKLNGQVNHRKNELKKLNL
tara:strand:- start:4048 stop:5553 length:1506 start_codon:yes stop_codon:yes gene_type:complete